LTHLSNYQAASTELFSRGLLPAADHLIHFPEKVMDEALAYLIISVGMRDGMFFTTQTMSQFIDLAHPATPAQRLAQYKRARHLVNGTDHDSDIAAIAVKFEKIVSLSRTEAPHWSTIVPPAPSVSLRPLGTAPPAVTPFQPKPGSGFPIGPF
jgi:hypothetical protein